MPRENRRPRKRPRAAPRPTAPEQLPESAPTSGSSAATTPRPIPGFVWDAEKRRYFPAVSRAATSREQQHAARQHQRVEQIVATQNLARRRIDRPSVPALLRQRSGHFTPAKPWTQSRRATADRLSFACMSTMSHPVPYAQPNSIVSALRLFSGDFGQRLMAVGHRNGTVVTARLSGDDDTGQSWTRSAAGEITAIGHLGNEAIFCASMGDGRSGGSLTYSQPETAAVCHTFENTSLFAACQPPAAHLRRTALGTSSGAVVVDLVDSVQQRFAMRCKSDIIGTALADANIGFAGGRDGQIRLFDVRLDGARHHPRKGLFSNTQCRHSSSVHGLGADGSLLVSASMDGQVHVWDIRMLGGERRSVPACLNVLSEAAAATSVCRLGFDVSQGVVAAADPGNQVRLWGLADGQLLQNIHLAASNGACTALDLRYAPGARPEIYVGQSASVYAYSDHTLR
ncbi:hypothetical protein H4S02_001752 [Coemansia sp. RSA 2611]|nr:hypothetical protein IWW54_001528 [Coemansia sp. RSA 2705]KAJ2362157.1 hypothetical protein H4S01_004919 [Coemansia sp. RSA 2610]KAJ2390628.1 hypothetical protein H4S02_001752 [Coemansia sp. RSA 2611]KAJ2737768.1 hypothetical protein H4R23_001611 [Coemansia sp. Cherry 401B]